MNIDRHNYEEYFLLYIDNELSVDQKKQVELFVQQNPDLEEELVMLKQSKLIPDDSIVFDKKHLLMKEGSDAGNHSFINLSNYEQWLIMYVDNELTAEEKAAVEKFASTHEHVLQELQLFQQTKIEPETLVFPNKEILYKREKAVRVISMQWWKVAVAAILIISAGITVYSVLINRGTNGTTGNTIAKTASEKKQMPPANRVKTDQQREAVAVNPQREEQLPASIPASKETHRQEKQDEQPVQETNQQLAYNAPNETVRDVQQHATVEIDKAGVEQPKIKDKIVFDDKMHKENINTDAVTKPAIETPDNSSTSNDAVQYASGTENKKFRGFFRKASRLIERTTNINATDDDNKVLIGGMAFNLK